ncbi:MULTISPECIES: DUF692 domain-containing protein [Halocynthiibacter]|uniref:UPF0276 protein OH136_04535 n=1 Tax=Halocynthiibacter halioticoli TaxID=2986804 RepID=A0AAE3J0C7_9RHOB|nr:MULTISPECIES: DUF692 domain-containing protein [Halocynthiibacter]MCV6823816.1 DUF692 domain-containing protein [Halocynthiibacter halioticoli]MCW4056817.1 DUF692 domain-containing protein [Halocynthiibacter sp. SDUM655004]
MLDVSPHRFDRLPDSAGVGYKPQHFSEIMNDASPVEWLEIHAENYMGDGGRPIAQLRALSERFPISVHGVGLSIGGEGPLDRDHLDRLKHLIDWLQPASFSEHLAWSTHDMGFMNDLLPLPYTEETLARICEHIDHVQEHVGRRMLLENPSAYLNFAETQIPETEFLRETAARTGCGLLFDVNNVFISATNQKTDPYSYIDAFPLDLVSEIHLAGHEEDTDENGDPLLIDSHGTPVAEPVWEMYRYTIKRGGIKPSLIEWDNDVPEWQTLASEAARATQVLQTATV